MKTGLQYRLYAEPSCFVRRILLSIALLSGVAFPHSVSAEEESTSEAMVLDKLTVEGDVEGQSIENNTERVASTGKVNVTIADTPFSISVVNEKFIENTGAKNMQDALLYSSGVYAGQFGFDTRGDWTAVRGLDAANYQDGLRTIYGFYNNVRTNAYTLENVEVLKGLNL